MTYAHECILNVHFYDRFTDAEHGRKLLSAIYTIASGSDRATFLSQFDDLPVKPRKNGLHEDQIRYILAQSVTPGTSAIELKELKTFLPFGVLERYASIYLDSAIKVEARADLYQFRIQTGYAFDTTYGILTDAQARKRACQLCKTTPSKIWKEAQGVLAGGTQ
jgi:hypothetical protein